MSAIIINADDYALSDGICQSILLLLEHGAVSNTTIMIAAEGAARRCKKYGIESLKARAGVHLQLTSGRPLSPRDEVLSLVDANTGMFLGPEHAGNSRTDEVEREWQRQIELVADTLQTQPTHLDSHHGVHRLSHLTPLYLALAQRYGMAVRGGVALDQIPSAQYGIRASRISVNSWTGRGLGLQALKEVILSTISMLNGVGTMELVTHPGFNDPYLESTSSFNRERVNDHACLLAMAEEQWLRNQNISLVRYPFLDYPSNE